MAALYGSRNSSSAATSTPERRMYSPSSAYSESEVSRKSSWSWSTASSNRKTVLVTTRSIAGLFRGCFTPPGTKTSKSSDRSVDSEEFKACSSVSERSRGSNKYVSSYKSTKAREPASVKFTMAEISKATRNFSPSFKVGQGGFGTVYKGRLDDGTWVAIKRAKKSVYDKHLGVEFQSEIQTLAQVEHLNLVKFYGYLEDKGERIVVVEYVSNGTLREHLDCMHGNVLDFAARLDAAIDVAHAVTYLHMYTDHPIIHRDIKSSNILLTDKFRAKVADFGFARLGVDSESGASHVSTVVKGTAGYLDPEYLRTYQLTEKSDVFSFGVLLVEMVTGRRPIDTKRAVKERITTTWALRKFSAGNAFQVLDPKLELTAAINLAVERILELALQCLAPHRQDRPSMRRCAEILWSVRKDYREQTPYLRSLSSTSTRTTSTREEIAND